MEFCQLSFKNSFIGYYRFGNGPKTAICFHGYGEGGESFGFLEKYAGTQFSFYSIDLPFHGKTRWKEDPDLSPADLVDIVTGILQQNNRALAPIILMGFSLGGRIALGLYQDMPEKIDRIILLAPDGLKVNFWYWLATQTGLGNSFFAFTMKKPGWFFGFLKLINKLKLVNASIFKFVKYYIGDAAIRQLLYARWTSLRKIRPQISRIKKEIGENKTKVSLIYGMHDRIILPSVGEKFRKGIEEQCTISIIHAGHQVLHEKHVQEILPALLP
ncbi:MAG: alpha/beta fold hydrolase [Chitinophagaceae bacterium]